jgi:hypothetical protein
VVVLVMVMTMMTTTGAPTMFLLPRALDFVKPVAVSPCVIALVACSRAVRRFSSHDALQAEAEHVLGGLRYLLL